MASVALFTVWAWRCPECNALVRAWKPDAAAYHGEIHRDQDCPADLAAWDRERSPRPFQMIWAFNVVTDVEGHDQPGIIDSLADLDA